MLWTLGGFTVSLTVLLLVIALYTGGNWFLLAAVPALFGLSVVFMPYVVYQLPLPNVLSRSKGLIVMVWDTLWLYALIVVCGWKLTLRNFDLFRWNNETINANVYLLILIVSLISAIVLVSIGISAGGRKGREKN